MAVLYSLIKKIENKQILTGEFSPQGKNAKIGNNVLKELNNVFDSMPEESNGRFFKFDSENDGFIFMLKVYSSFALAVIVDSYSSEGSILKYFEGVHEEFKKVYKEDPRATYYFFDSTLAKLSDKFNKDSRYKQGLEAVGETKDILAQSLNLIIQRKENIDNLNKLATRMSLEAKQMQSNIKKMHLRCLMQEYGFYAVILFIIFLVLYFIVH